MSNSDIGPEQAEDSASIYSPPGSDLRFTPAGDLFAAYVGPNNADYYRQQFAQIKGGSNGVSWHWSAFFYASLWLLYRKMWLNALLYWLVLPIALAALTAVVSFAVGDAAAGILYYILYTLIAFIVIPMYANLIYYKHVEAKVNKVAADLPAEQQAAELERIGGTSPIALGVVLVLYVVLIVLGLAVVIPLYRDLMSQ